jgi:CubicO group peptidase (beta-lactamase class C family)
MQKTVWLPLPPAIPGGTTHPVPMRQFAKTHAVREDQHTVVGRIETYSVPERKPVESRTGGRGRWQHVRKSGGLLQELHCTEPERESYTRKWSGIMKFNCLFLLAVSRVARVICLVILLFGSSTIVSAEEDVENHKGIRLKDISQFVDQQTSDSRIISDFTIRREQRSVVFDVTTQKNTDGTPWVVLWNVSADEFEKAEARYAAEFFQLSLHRTIGSGRRERHSAIWIQQTDAGDELRIADGDRPKCGTTDQLPQPLTEMLEQLLKEHNIPGVTVAVGHQGQVLCECGIGYAELDPMVPMNPDAMQRIASLSKPITAVAILILVQEGKLQLDQSALTLLKSHPDQYDVEKTLAADSKWNSVTIRHLLRHSGGWDRDKSRDTMFQLQAIAESQKLKSPPKIDDVLRYQLTQSFDFDPGTQYAYSNVGYCLLGRIIEVVSGQPYEEFVQQRILIPAGMKQTRLGRTRLADRAEGEVRYYTQKTRRSPAFWSVISRREPSEIELVPAPYGVWDLEIMDAHGGWISTAGDLVRFAQAIDQTESPLLTPESRQLIVEKPSFTAADESVWYGLGWNVRPSGQGYNQWHTGALAGTSTLLVRRADGYSWAVLFNADRSSNGKRCTELVDSLMHQAVNRSFERDSE